MGQMSLHPIKRFVNKSMETKKVEIEIPAGKKAVWVNGVLTLVDEKPQDVTERIKTFEDALDELEVRAANGDNKAKMLYDDWHNVTTDSDDLIAYLQLRIITAALNEGWEPQFTKGERRWYFWYDLITKEQYDKLSAEDKSRVVGRGGGVAYAFCGLVYAYAFHASSYSYTRSTALGSPSKAKNSQPTQVGSSPRFMPTSVSNQSRRKQRDNAGAVWGLLPPHCHFSNKQTVMQ